MIRFPDQNTPFTPHVIKFYLSYHDARCAVLIVLISVTRNLLQLEIRSVERGICLIAEYIMTVTVTFQCACVKLPYFYFRSEI